jgi:hypothetical protein
MKRFVGWFTPPQTPAAWKSKNNSARNPCFMMLPGIFQGQFRIDAFVLDGKSLTGKCLELSKKKENRRRTGTIWCPFLGNSTALHKITVLHEFAIRQNSDHFEFAMISGRQSNKLECAQR